MTEQSPEAPRKAWERDVLRRFLERAPATGEAVDYIHALTTAMLDSRGRCPACAYVEEPRRLHETEPTWVITRPCTAHGGPPPPPPDYEPLPDPSIPTREGF